MPPRSAPAALHLGRAPQGLGDLGLLLIGSRVQRSRVPFPSSQQARAQVPENTLIALEILPGMPSVATTYS